MDVRLKLAELQKSRKRQLPIDESSEMVEQQHRPEVFYSDYEIDSEAEENSGEELIKFDQGFTDRGKVAIWHAGYRYVKQAKTGNYWRCSNRDCSALAKANQNPIGQFVGTLGTKEHNHPPSIQKKISEEIRSKLKINKRPILAEVRSNVSDEVYIALGSDHALQQLMRR